MRTTPLFVSACLALVLAVSLSPARAADAKIEQAITDLDNLWSAAAGSNDLDKTVSYYADSALVMPPNEVSVSTKEGIRNAWKAMFGLPGFSITWKTTKVEVAQSGDLAYSSGTWTMTMNDPTGKPAPDHGKYVEVWKKQTDGKWKVAVDIWNSDLPVPASEKK